ncbi:hypothetical protein HPB48_020966 [Haemaphysalis longicornis]|uniref:Uncharacterized protein n=1 Tax=Haemaphysalis longicornis TaxID=44386 RepID=A0A9J6FB13_HAELO|nr:hypothetical protein HPB48_020966 [Haemaphysalis longicornis]
MRKLFGMHRIGRMQGNCSVHFPQANCHEGTTSERPISCLHAVQLPSDLFQCVLRKCLYTGTTGISKVGSHFKVDWFFFGFKKDSRQCLSKVSSKYPTESDPLTVHVARANEHGASRVPRPLTGGCLAGLAARGSVAAEEVSTLSRRVSVLLLTLLPRSREGFPRCCWGGGREGGSSVTGPLSGKARHRDKAVLRPITGWGFTHNQVHRFHKQVAVSVCASQKYVAATSE